MIGPAADWISSTNSVERLELRLAGEGGQDPLSMLVFRYHNHFRPSDDGQLNRFPQSRRAMQPRTAA